MLVYFDIKFIRQDQKQRWNGEACRASQKCFWSTLITRYQKTFTWLSSYYALLEDLMAK